jgi:hypothetical protein
MVDVFEGTLGMLRWLAAVCELSRICKITYDAPTPMISRPAAASWAVGELGRAIQEWRSASFRRL